MNQVRAVVLKVLSNKIRYFSTFAKIPPLKKANKQSQQYKTEKWFQAELIFRFWEMGVQALPEYKLTSKNDAYSWDVYIPSDKTAVQPTCYLALKCLSDSWQNDWQSVKKDLDTILSFNAPKAKACMAVVLPNSNNRASHRWKYRDGMLRKIRNHIGIKLEIELSDLFFTSASSDGITFVWME